MAPEIEIKINTLEVMMKQNEYDHKSLRFLIEENDRNLITLIDKLDKKLDTMSVSFVTEKEFTPVRNIAYGMVSVVMLAFLGSLIGMAIVK